MTIYYAANEGDNWAPWPWYLLPPDINTLSTEDRHGLFDQVRIGSLYFHALLWADDEDQTEMRWDCVNGWTE